MVIFGAGIVGEVTLHACHKLGIAVECFVDDRIEGELLGVKIIRSDELCEEELLEPSFYLTSPNIADMIQRLNAIGYTDWRSCGEVLRDLDVEGLAFRSINGSNQASSYSTEHVKYLIRTCLHHHDNYMHPDRLTVQSVDLMITEKCSMKCKDCSNLMAYYEKPENADLNEMLATIDAMCERMDEMYEVRLIGGEPFVNKDIHLVCEKLTSKENVRKVSIFTNATIVPREHQWKSFEHEKVRFFITDYDALSRNIQKLIPELERRGVPYVSEKANGWTDCAALDRHDRTDKENTDLFSACCAKNLATLHDGNLFRCPFSANAHKLQAVPNYTEDYLVVAKADREQIRTFLRDKAFIRACDHCNGRSYGAPVIAPAVQTKIPLKYVRYARGA